MDYFERGQEKMKKWMVVIWWYNLGNLTILANLDNLDNLDNFKVNTGSGINFTFNTLNFSDQTFCGVKLTRKILRMRFGRMRYF